MTVSWRTQNSTVIWWRLTRCGRSSVFPGSGRLSNTLRSLKIGGGKERMASLFLEREFQQVFPVPESEEDRKALITRWHKEKTAIYQQIIASGAIPPRSGIKRIAESALAAGWKLAVASTSAQPSVEAVLIHVVGESTAKRFTVLAGDVVAAKKPAPDIYLLAIKELGIARRKLRGDRRLPKRSLVRPYPLVFRFW